MSSRTAGTIILLSTALFACLLRAQTTPDPDSDQARIATYCQSMANGHEQTEVLKNACQYALTVQKKLPDYICDEKVRRFNAAGFLQDVVDTEVTIIDGGNTYSNIRINGIRKDTSISQLPGLWSSGEFGTLIPLLFAPENKADFRFKKVVRLKSRPVLLFSFEILESDNRSLFVRYEDGTPLRPGYSGSIWLDQETGRTIRLEMLSTRRRSRYIGLDAEYGDVQLKDGLTFLLPLRSSLKSCTDRSAIAIVHDGFGGSVPCARNELEFTNCRKFRAETKITGVE